MECAEITVTELTALDAAWKLAGERAERRGQYIYVIHKLMDGNATKVHEYKIKLAQLSNALIESTLKYKTFPFNVPHSHKITLNSQTVYDRSLAEWGTHIQSKGLLEESSVKECTCHACKIVYYDTSSHTLCSTCYEKAQAQAKKKALKLCVAAEKLQNSSDWQDTAEKIKALQLDWKQLSNLPRSESSILWEAFQQSTQNFFTAREAFFKQQDIARNQSKQQAEFLILKAEHWGHSEDWKEAADVMKRLQAEWKKLGALPKQDSQRLWQTFSEITQGFFDRRQRYFDEQEKERDRNRDKAERLIEQVENWVWSEDWKHAATEIKNLQRDWKSVHPLPKSCADGLWQKFSALTQSFFDRMSKHYADKKQAWKINTENALLRAVDAKKRISESVQHDQNLLLNWQDKLKKSGKTSKTVILELEHKIAAVSKNIKLKKDKLLDIERAIISMQRQIASS